MIRISFLLPCYKVEKYIRECLNSIYRIAIPVDEFEVLCFDDCSPDSTPQILDEYANLHANMKVIHSKENIGSGGGRNALVKHAKGNYIWYIDPDDMIIPEKVAGMLSQVELNDLDVLLFNFNDMTEDGRISIGSTFKDTEIQEGLAFVDSVFGNSIVWHIGYPVRFVVRREYILEKHLFFPEKIVFQDTVWMPKLLIYANRVQATHVVAYIYWRHETSVCGRFDKEYPATSIYTRCITICKLLLSFATELEDMSKNNRRYAFYAKLFHDFAQSYYLNNLPLFLCRTSKKERRKFYYILSQNGVPDEVSNIANKLTSLCLHPYMGYVFSSILSFGYKLKHK